jgi:hypothetical protein
VKVWYLAFVSTQMSFDKICHVQVTTKFDGQVLLLLFMPVNKVGFLLFPGFVNNRMSFTEVIMNSRIFLGGLRMNSFTKDKSKIVGLQIIITTL